MIDFLSMGKHTIFIYIAYIFSILVLLFGYFQIYYKLKKEIYKKKYEDNKNQ